MSSIVFAYLMGSLTDLISTLNSSSHELEEKKTQLSRYMQWRGVPRKLMMSIRQHLLFLWDTNLGYDAYEEFVKDILPPVLKTELCFHIYGRVITNAPFLSWMKDYHICVKHLTNSMQSIFLENGDMLFQMGHANTQIYILLKGTVWLSRNQKVYDEGSATCFASMNADGIDPFKIPRQQDRGVAEVEDAMLTVFSAVQAETNKLVGMDAYKAEGDMGANKGNNAKQAATKDKNDSQSYYGVTKTGHLIFDSQVLTEATVKLQREDIRRKSAALKLQRLWRLRKTFLELPRNLNRNNSAAG